MFIRLDKTPERGRRTDRQTARNYYRIFLVNKDIHYNGLHCEQCGRAVNKTVTLLKHVQR